ncbi:IS607 family transposase [Nonomuraea sp. NPDC050022]|uniref:IS607 family transposase n=1 Tax=unclassified Nonomuraea TaxID=2593643 RepID=UPI0033E62C11
MLALLRLAAAAKRLGVHPTTLRSWADQGQIRFVWVGKAQPERRFDEADLDAFAGVAASSVRERVEVAYVRVSGAAGQETFLAAQEDELRRTSRTGIVKVYQDRASGLRENRPGLNKLLADAVAGKFTVVRITHQDRLARFGVAWISALLARDGVSVEVLHAKGSAGGVEELLADFMALTATFAGRMYGIRSREARKRLLAQADTRINAASPPEAGV